VAVKEILEVAYSDQEAPDLRRKWVHTFKLNNFNQGHM
jgi:hypothetical protein